MKKQLLLGLLVVGTATGMSADTTVNCTNVATNTYYKKPNAVRICTDADCTSYAVTQNGNTICLCCNRKMIKSSFIANNQHEKYYKYLKKYNISR